MFGSYRRIVICFLTIHMAIKVALTADHSSGESRGEFRIQKGIRNSVAVYKIISGTSAGSKIGCAAECLRSRGCRIFNYDSKTAVCELSSDNNVSIRLQVADGIQAGNNVMTWNMGYVSL